MKVEPASGSVAPSVATTVPAAAFSATEPPATVMSVGASFWLVTAMLTVSVRVRPPASVTVTLTWCEVAVS